jgi:autotransporter-associated beta strand protein
VSSGPHPNAIRRGPVDSTGVSKRKVWAIIQQALGAGLSIRKLGIAVLAALASTSWVLAQNQVNQNFIGVGPGPSTGPRDVVGSADNPPNGTVTGAVQSIVTSPTDPNTYYIGTPGGGIWVTHNAGVTWTALTDNQASLSIASLAIDPTNASTLVAGTGLTSNGTVCRFGGNNCFFTGTGGLRTGLLFSTNGGTSWTSVGASTFSGQSVDAVTVVGNTILAGTFEPDFASSATQRTVGALYRSTNGGTSFTQISGGVGTGLPNGPITSLVTDPTNPNHIYAAVASPSLANIAAGLGSTSVYVSNDGGATWSAVFAAGQSGGTINTTTQTAVKIAAGPGGTLAAAVINLGTGALTGLFYSTNSGTSWSALPVPNVNGGNQAPVNLAVAIDPNNSKFVYVSGDNNFSNNGGINAVAAVRIDTQLLTTTPLGDDTSVPTNTSNGSTVHPDSRTIAFDASGRLLLSSDGGIYSRSSPQTTTGAWTSVNGNLSVSQPYTVALDANSKLFVVAAQDNGAEIQTAPGNAAYRQLIAGDGINAVVNDRTLSGQSAIYTSSQNLGQLNRLIVDSSGNVVSPGAGPGGIAVNLNTGVIGNNFYSLFVLNKVDPMRIAVTGSDVYVTQDTLTGANGVAAASITLNLTDVGSANGTVTSVAYGTRDNHNVLVAGSSGAAALYISTTAAAASLTPVLAYAGQAPTSIVFDPRSQNRFYAVDFSNLYGTQNQGTTFSTLTANLPTTLVTPSAVEFISNNGVNALLVGGESDAANAQSPIAVADSDATGNLSNWRLFGTGLPNSTVSQLVYNPAIDAMAVATFGRGVFALYDVTSYFAQATLLQFGLANNNSAPDASFLTDGTTGGRPLIKYGTGTLTISGAATYTGGTTIENGIIQLGNGGAGGSILGNVTFCSNAADPNCNTGTNKALVFDRSDVSTFSGSITGPGQVAQIGSGTVALLGTNTYTGGTTISSGTLQLGNGGTTGSIVGNVTDNGTFAFARSDAFTFGGVISGSGGVQQIGSGTVTLTAANTYTGTTIVTGGTLEIGNGGSVTGSAALMNSANFVVDGGGSATFGSVINTATGTITVAPGGAVHDDLNNAGMVTNNGSYFANVASNTGVITNNGTWTGTVNNMAGAFSGTGMLVGNLTNGNGAVFAPGSGTPGSSMTINGSLAFSQGAFYQVSINPATASFVTASGTSTLGGASVQAFFSSGTYVSKQYTIVNAAGGVIGSFGAVSTTNLPSGFSSSLSYDATHAFLNLALNFTPPVGPANNGLNVNQRNVGNALINSFNTAGVIPIVFGALTPTGLTQASGELATSSQQTTFKAMDLFLGLLTDPFMGRGSGINAATAPAGYAEDDQASAYAARKKSDAYAMFTKATPPAIFQQRWSVWAAGYGGSQSTNGNAFVGSNDTTSRIAGTAVGADYLFSPDTLAGFALAGGGTSFTVNNLGSGRSDLFQAGAYVRHTQGNAYITGALAYGWQDITTDRNVAIAGVDHLRAEFNANTYSGRVEGGYRYVVPAFGGLGITPYAAGQFTTFDLPSYAESVVSGAALFALNYAGKSVTDSRSELGIRSDKSFAMQNGVLTLRSRVAWAHDFDPDRSIGATFQSLPVASFVVNGAAQASDSVLTTGSVEMKWRNNWSIATTFEGEFSNVTSSYAGKGVVRYAW